ncbi:eukaryotic translation initiation factor 4 gamma 2-like [Terrapene carolina triunguis]|uniref:eukaryotic translation initiation factor 4 gamma 2-like n=1 Tax=Terrapene triunguis TaxID=2587831 RepID=UPI0011562963|nr:eukaryotic translation initiation factor 4 gamma 2-like [Terrapene carolina triunguis]
MQLSDVSNGVPSVLVGGTIKMGNLCDTGSSCVVRSPPSLPRSPAPSFPLPSLASPPALGSRRDPVKLTRPQGRFFFPPPCQFIILLKILRCQAAKVESAIAEGGASRFSASSGGGGSRGAPQHYPKTASNSEFLGKTPGQNAQKWIPSRSTRRDDDSANDKERHDAIFRKVRGILNKLTPEKFDKLCLELLNVGVESKLILKGIILLVSQVYFKYI